MHRKGISLLEVLVALFVVGVGLIGVASLVSVGGLQLAKVEQSDRTGALGRAALRDIKIRGLLNHYGWSQGPSPGSRVLPSDSIISAFALDPLGYAHGVTGNVGPLLRYTLLQHETNPTPSPPTWIPPPPALGTQMSLDVAGSIFVSHDDLVFDSSTDTSQRPVAVTETDPITGDTVTSYSGHYSWFATVNPSENEASLPIGGKRNLSVSIVVCKGRDFSAADKTSNVTALTGGIGGCTVTLETAIPELKKDDWVLLTGEKTVVTDWGTIPPTTATATYARWYRVVVVGQNQMVGLVGPDWDCAMPGGWTVTMAYIDGVAGVYSGTVVLESSLN